VSAGMANEGLVILRSRQPAWLAQGVQSLG